MPHTLQGFKAELFKALAHPARIRILEHLRSGERTVSELQALLDLESSTVSQQLALLRARSIVEGRKQGTSVYYRVPDPLIFELLDVARQIFANHVVGLQAMADEQPGVPRQVGEDARRGGDDQISPADLVVVTPADGADGAERS